MTLSDWIVLVLALVLVFDSGPGRAVKLLGGGSH